MNNENNSATTALLAILVIAIIAFGIWFMMRDSAAPAADDNNGAELNIDIDDLPGGSGTPSPAPAPTPTPATR